MMDQATQAMLMLMHVADGRSPDWQTSAADARAAICLARGVPQEHIGPLGHDYTERAYASVRASWVRHIEQWGLRLPTGGDMAESGLHWAHGLWLANRPDLAEGDDWLTPGWEAHERRYPDGCGGSCDLCCSVLR
jgi:hypothetical protein